MELRHIWFSSILVISFLQSIAAQTPTLGSIQSPYPNLGSQLTIAGQPYARGAVAYGPQGTPLVLSGSNFGVTGTVNFHGGVSVTPTTWTPTMIIIPVPSGATTGLVTITTSGGSSNGLPFMVMEGTYTGYCPVPSDTEMQIITASLQDGIVNQAYSVSLQATGGTQPYTWSISGGSLPAGLSLFSSGTISGTPITASGPVSLTIQAIDQNQKSTQALLTLAIDGSLVTTGAVYGYTVPSGGFDGAGNILTVHDSVMGNWSFSYDQFNRLSLANAANGDYDGDYACWNYDSFGNREQQVLSTGAFQSGSGGPNACEPQDSSMVLSTALADYTASNQVASTNARGVTAIPGYDAAGNITSDGANSYLYDPEGRICAVKMTVSGSSFMTGYLYDAEGNRIAKGSIASWGSCDPVENGFQTSSANTSYYVLGQGGEELSMFSGSGAWQRSNVFGGNKLLATYDTSGLHFHLTDPLGTRRVQTNSSGMPELDCESLPFGDQQNCFPDPNAPVTADDATPLHFTGKERDSESGNDYFGARYYASSMGRWLSPDWSKTPEGVPYADLTNPQSLNLYGYVLNNPLAKPDLDGHGCPPDCIDLMAIPMMDVGTQQAIANNPYVQGGMLIAASAMGAPEVGAAAIAAETVPEVLGAGAAALTVTGTAVNGTSTIIGAATNTNVSAGTNMVTNVTNPVAGTFGLATGSAEKGSQAADLATVVKAGVSVAQGKGVSNPADVATSVSGAKAAVSNIVNSVTSTVSGALAPTPPPPAPPAPPPPPPCSVAGACSK